jgi:hypothetical protein
MLRKLAPSFVVTTVALGAGCHSSPSDLPSMNPPAPTDPAPTPRPTINANPPPLQPTATAPPKPTAKRKRTTDAGRAWSASAPVDWSDLQPLNPTDAQGRTVYAAMDDTCYVEVPMKPPYPPMPTGSRYVDTVAVDCPAAMNDPAWDTCDGSTLSRSKAKGECYCLPMGGNPPPPPVKNRCPK